MPTGTTFRSANAGSENHKGDDPGGQRSNRPDHQKEVRVRGRLVIQRRKVGRQPDGIRGSRGQHDRQDGSKPNQIRGGCEPQPRIWVSRWEVPSAGGKAVSLWEGRQLVGRPSTREWAKRAKPAARSADGQEAAASAASSAYRRATATDAGTPQDDATMERALSRSAWSNGWPNMGLSSGPTTGSARARSVGRV